MKGNNYIKKKKKQEWEAIKNVITDINEYLDINIIPYNVQYVYMLNKKYTTF